MGFAQFIPAQDSLPMPPMEVDTQFRADWLTNWKERLMIPRAERFKSSLVTQEYETVTIAPNAGWRSELRVKEQKVLRVKRKMASLPYYARYVESPSPTEVGSPVNEYEEASKGLDEVTFREDYCNVGITIASPPFVQSSAVVV